MTDNLPIFRGRATPTASPATRDAVLDVQIKKAEMLAQMGNALPMAYRGRGAAGAMLMALDYADRNNVDIMDVVRWVGFINGKIVVETDLAVKIARREGIRVEVEDLDDAARARLHGPDGTVYQWWTYTLAEAQTAGLLDKKGPWTDHPKIMLRHRARKHALQFDGPMVSDVLPVPAEHDDEEVAVAELERENDPEPEQPQTEVLPLGPSADELRAALKAATWQKYDVEQWLEQEGYTRPAHATKLADTDEGRHLMAVLTAETP